LAQTGLSEEDAQRLAARWTRLMASALTNALKGLLVVGLLGLGVLALVASNRAP
jgi:hypothetical protein